MGLNHKSVWNYEIIGMIVGMIDRDFFSRMMGWLWDVFFGIVFWVIIEMIRNGLQSDEPSQ